MGEFIVVLATMGTGVAGYFLLTRKPSPFAFISVFVLFAGSVTIANGTIENVPALVSRGVATLIAGFLLLAVTPISEDLAAFIRRRAANRNLPK